ncbi:MAG TPA: hypothetical protein VG368_00810, partial [Acidimicrobiales bacterium]|nr:hypothetical protein [Acidimicrobiales bacterium]
MAALDDRRRLLIVRRSFVVPVDHLFDELGVLHSQPRNFRSKTLDLVPQAFESLSGEIFLTEVLVAHKSTVTFGNGFANIGPRVHKAALPIAPPTRTPLQFHARRESLADVALSSEKSGPYLSHSRTFHSRGLQFKHHPRLGPVYLLVMDRHGRGRYLPCPDPTPRTFLLRKSA